MDDDRDEWTSMRTPKDVVRMIGVLASMDGLTISDFTKTDLREWVLGKYRARVAAESKAVTAAEG